MIPFLKGGDLNQPSPRQIADTPVPPSPKKKMDSTTQIIKLLIIIGVLPIILAIVGIIFAIILVGLNK